MTESPKALLLDVDGTLLDTVYQHVLAWWEAFEAHGHQVSCFDVHRQIGRGSGDLVSQLVGHEDEALVEAHTQNWERLRERCHVFHSVPELIREVSGRGVRVVFCTSGSEDDTTTFREKIGCDDVVHAVVSSADVEVSKPEPDIVRKALEAAGAAPEDAVMVGDTVYDVRAAKAAGVRCIGVLAGGIGEKELREAGADAVYGNVAELLEGLEGSPVGTLLS
ncbi:MAG: putative Phosphoglycolate phosphatase [Frankiales bacterium]|nr:putative Phosphoglycolate phosphatase [Frankiales bacterium]